MWVKAKMLAGSRPQRATHFPRSLWSHPGKRQGRGKSEWGASRPSRSGSCPLFLLRVSESRPSAAPGLPYAAVPHERCGAAGWQTQRDREGWTAVSSAWTGDPAAEGALPAQTPLQPQKGRGTGREPKASLSLTCF